MKEMRLVSREETQKKMKAPINTCVCINDLNLFSCFKFNNIIISNLNYIYISKVPI